MKETQVAFFKPSGKWYTTEAVPFSDDVSPSEAALELKEYLKGRLAGCTAVAIDPPWGYPQMWALDNEPRQKALKAASVLCAAFQPLIEEISEAEETDARWETAHYALRKLAFALDQAGLTTPAQVLKELFASERAILERIANWDDTCGDIGTGLPNKLREDLDTYLWRSNRGYYE